MRKLGRKELENIVLGGGLLGAGGGGSVTEGMKLVETILKFSDTVNLLHPDDAGNEDWGVVIAGMGSPRASLTRVRTNSPRFALEMLEEVTGNKSSFVIPFEPGAGNSLNPMLAAVQKGIPIIDGDPAGRAVPEISMTTFNFAGVPICPFALATEDGVSVLIKSEHAADVERVARAVTAEMQGVSAIACYAIQGRQMRESIIPGTTTLIEGIGKIISSCRDRHKELCTSLITEFCGFLIGEGRVIDVKGETRGGFDFGVVTLEGKQDLTVFFQNENMLAFRNDKLLAMVPDLICAVSSEGIPLTNADIEVGMELSYLGFQAHDRFRTERAIGCFTPILAAMGYTEGFQPVEGLNDKEV
jgi:uncharacterized protein